MQTVPVAVNDDGIDRAENSRGRFLEVTDDYTVNVNQHGYTFTANDAGDGVIFTLPVPTPGLEFTFVKKNATTDIHLQAPAGVTVGTSAAGKVFENITDEVGTAARGGVRVQAVSATEYAAFPTAGTWVINNT